MNRHTVILNFFIEGQSRGLIWVKHDKIYVINLTIKLIKTNNNSNANRSMDDKQEHQTHPFLIVITSNIIK